jgi:hypothetical protein
VTVTSDKVSRTITISYSTSHAIVHVVFNVNCTEHHSLVISIPALYLGGIIFYSKVTYCKYGFCRFPMFHKANSRIVP